LAQSSSPARSSSLFPSLPARPMAAHSAHARFPSRLSLIPPALSRVPLIGGAHLSGSASTSRSPRVSAPGPRLRSASAPQVSVRCRLIQAPTCSSAPACASTGHQTPRESANNRNSSSSLLRARLPRPLDPHAEVDLDPFKWCRRNPLEPQLAQPPALCSATPVPAPPPARRP
jgi:hypothetical protein